ncbi:short transient receptor potential channel 4-like isoform X2 [Orbicella faveolata]|nr:short transient receptor potential channel 4-like isoform X2 [Orbicella faveolata]
MKKLLSKKNSFDAIEKKITPKTLTKCVSNSLLMGMKVNYRLRSLAKCKGSEGEMFNKLANSVEDFTTRLLDPMQSDQLQREGFGYFILDDILDEAIDLKQKKFFTHPVVHSEMTRKWRGRFLMKKDLGKWTWFFLHIWCLFDMVFAPITFYIVSYLEVYSLFAAYYLKYLKTPYFIFVRDALSYLALVVLHYAFCLTPSRLAFSGLEWSILIFFMGRSLVEYRQIRLTVNRIKERRKSGKDETNSNVLRKALCSYISDRWNRLDVFSVLTYLVIFVLRLTTWITSESVKTNRAVLVAGYLYSFNTLCLTLRISHVIETFKGLGTIQIALFNVLQDVFTIVWQFIAAVLAFSVAITKIYMAEKSFHASASNQQNLACKTSGVLCWWEILTHLSWSLLEIEQEFNPLNSVDTPSETIAKLFYAVFLFIAVILLVNMLIALLSHTYQRVKDNSLKEWSYKKAVTIQTYESYNPIHAPLNIVSEFFLLHWWSEKKKRRERRGRRASHQPHAARVKLSKTLFQHLEAKYFAKHGNLFPVTDEKKLDEVYQETEKNRQMLSQILLRTVNNQSFDITSRRINPQAWDIVTGINVHGNVLTCEGVEDYKTEADPDKWVFGARYTHRLCPEFPHFEVLILEAGIMRRLGIGVVMESYSKSLMPGWRDGTVGYHIDHGKVFDGSPTGKETKGYAMAFRGDLIRCTVVFKHAKKISNTKVRVPVVFTLNDKRITPEGQGGELFTYYNPNGQGLFPYIGMMDKGCSVLAKMSGQQEEKGYQNLDTSLKNIYQEHQNLKTTLADVCQEVKQMKECLEENNKTLKALLARLNGTEDTPL